MVNGVAVVVVVVVGRVVGAGGVEMVMVMEWTLRGGREGAGSGQVRRRRLLVVLLLLRGRCWPRLRTLVNAGSVVCGGWVLLLLLLVQLVPSSLFFVLVRRRGRIVVGRSRRDRRS